MGFSGREFYLILPNSGQKALAYDSNTGKVHFVQILVYNRT